MLMLGSGWVKSTFTRHFSRQFKEESVLLNNNKEQRTVHMVDFFLLLTSNLVSWYEWEQFFQELKNKLHGPTICYFVFFWGGGACILVFFFLLKQIQILKGWFFWVFFNVCFCYLAVVYLRQLSNQK